MRRSGRGSAVMVFVVVALVLLVVAFVAVIVAGDWTVGGVGATGGFPNEGSLPYTRNRGTLRKLTARLPVPLFRLGLGPLFLSKVLLLSHTGRKSGRHYHTALLVLGSDPPNGTYHVLSGWGARSDWLKNVEATPRVRVTVGRRRFDAIARVLPPAESDPAFLRYALRHPLRVRVLARLVREPLAPTEEGYRDLARRTRLVELKRL